MLRPRLLATAFWAGLGLLAVLAVTGLLDEVFPRELAKDLAEDSEALPVALGLAAWVQLVRPRLRGSRTPWRTTGLVAAGCGALGVWLYATGPVPGEVETLCEPLLALALLVPYVQAHRPLPRRLVLGLPVAVLLVVLAASGSALVDELAEVPLLVVLVALGLDVVDREVLEPAVRTPWRRRAGWWAFLLVTPVLLSVVLRDALPGPAGDAVTWVVRGQEAWVGALLLQVHLGLAAAARQAGGTAYAPARAG